jgi:hypothetical protein
MALFRPDAMAASFMSTYPHTLLMLVVMPLTVLTIPFISAPNLWLSSLFWTSGLILFSPISGLVDHLLVRAVLAKYVMHVVVGSVFCDKRMCCSEPLAFFLLGIALYFFICPIQSHLME